MPSTRMEGAFSLLEERVDERRDRRALGEHDQAAEDHHPDQDRQQPELLALLHEGPEFDEDGAHNRSFQVRIGSSWIAAAAPAGSARSSRSWRWGRASVSGSPCPWRA